MNKKSKEIMCLNRLQETTQQLDSILDFLRQESLLDEQSVKNAKGSPDFAKYIQETLRELQIKNKFQLLEYEWNLLPIENIRIYIVTDRNQAEFVFNG
jgi:hypothetical protein